MMFKASLNPDVLLSVLLSAKKMLLPWDMKIVAGHVGTAEIANNPRFHDIYFDGESHYYIDGTVLDSGEIPVLAVDTVNDKYYRVTDSGLWIVEP